MFRSRYNSLRYAGRDYCLPGKYFITICTVDKIEWFGIVDNGRMHLSEIGQIAFRMWYEIPFHFPFIDLDEFVIMPDHMHGIIIINKSIPTSLVGTLHATPLPQYDVMSVKNETMSSISPKQGSLSVVLRSFKSAVTKYAHRIDNDFSWQTGFYDSIICTNGQLNRIRKYILDNPQNWNKNNPPDLLLFKNIMMF